MSKRAINDAHHLLFSDYKFPLEDKAFLEKIAYHYYSGNGHSRRVTETIRETLRIMTSHPGFVAQYAVNLKKSSTPDFTLFDTVHEHVAFIGQEGLTYATLVMTSGPIAVEGLELSMIETVNALERELNKTTDAADAISTVTMEEWWLDGSQAHEPLATGSSQDRYVSANTFQLATFLYEWRRILLDAPSNFKGKVWDDGHRKIHLVLTQASPVEFADEQLYVHLTLVHPSTFNAAIIESQKQAA
jgi:hypothetical protein